MKEKIMFNSQVDAMKNQNTKKKPQNETRERVTTRDRIDRVCDILKETLQHKNADYGDSAFKPPLMCFDMSPGSAILVRMSDKINRIITLEERRALNEQFDAGVEFVSGESLADSYLDLAGYALLRIIDLAPESLKPDF